MKNIGLAILTAAAIIIATVCASNTLARPTAYGTAYWTGKVDYITTVTGKQGVRCEYSYIGHKFWMTFAKSSCPTSVEVQ